MIATILAATETLLARESEIIQRLSLAGELRDDQTGQHVARVARISRILADRMGLDRAFVEDLYRASPMHDVGKISIPDAILHKPGRLNPAERQEMEKHARRGYEILSGSESDLVQLAAEIALSHHERWDGTGYPNRLAAEQIPMSGRLTAVADVCDALFSERPYKKPWPAENVRRHFIDNAGTHFDPTCVDALIASWPEIEALYNIAQNRGCLDAEKSHCDALRQLTKIPGSLTHTTAGCVE
jgi:putative two-component system response regulator